MKTTRKFKRFQGTPYVWTGFLVILLIHPGSIQSQTDELGFELPAASAPQIQQKKPKKGPFGEDPKIIVDPERVMELAQTDHIALIQWASATYQKRVQDYTGTLIKQERLKGKLKKTEQISVMFKEKPFSVCMKWQQNAGSIDKLLYVEGKYDNKMIVHPTGLFSWIKSVKRDPTGKDAKKATLRTCDQFGFYRSMKSLLDLYIVAQNEGDLTTKYVGQTKVDNRPCIALERTLPNNKKYPYKRLVVEFDIEYLLPVSVSMYDWQNQLLSRYVFLNLKFNNGLTNARFTPKACGL